MRMFTFTISSYVSSSISTVVMVSSTSPRIMLRCWSYACGEGRAPKHMLRIDPPVLHAAQQPPTELKLSGRRTHT